MARGQRLRRRGNRLDPFAVDAADDRTCQVEQYTQQADVVLLYATDFADRLEKEIIPALKAGFIVLSDRYIFTALARAGVRGVDRQWLRTLYGSRSRRT
jgi:thymidylate kinase